MSSIGLSDAYLHIPSTQPQGSTYGFFTVLPFGLVMAPQVFTMIVKKKKVKEVKLMALTRGVRLHQYLDNWLIITQDEAQVNTQTVVDLTQSLGWIINQEKSKLEPTQVFSFVTYKYHLENPLKRDDSNFRI